MTGLLNPKHLSYNDPRVSQMQAGDLFLARRGSDDIAIDWTDFPPPGGNPIDPTLVVNTGLNPPINSTNLFVRDYAKPLLSNRDEYFHDLSLKIRSIGGFNTYEWHVNVAGTPSINDGTGWTITGTQGIIAQNLTNKLSRMRRNVYTTSATINSAAGIRNTGGASIWRGNGTQGGGFFFFCRFSANNVGNTVYSVGVQDTTVATSTPPNSIFDGIVFGKTATGNWSLFPRNANTGTPIVVTTNLSSNICFEFSMFAPPNGSFVRCRIDRIDTTPFTTLFLGDLTADLPAANIPLFSEARIVTAEAMVKAFGLGKLFFMAQDQ